VAALPLGAQDLAVWAADRRLATHPLPVCLVWNHSVTGGLVADCLDAEAGLLVLRRSYLHDAAAGLGEVPGRGRMRPEPRGGYWIEAIDEPLPQGLILRVGSAAVAHRLMPDPFGRLSVPLPLDAGRVILRLAP
jgi:hypothetical protein